ncbi:Phospholipase D/Transphosphatidylase domain-containing protein [Aromatoleum bremense]|uniref:Phospholipase n=1 Tax=Aromatoleum bremense TaxID=76115 RepID=A0ABX1NZ81_9RHOO|nr:VTT domain-containing protein [Aromatoleum bremense]NMG17088.1 phospholipase [Aromatoleum bremense]QTQ33437.1 Phospholipase D/Transphosphatidylase domain-containing protein [Aromatoleum bremense]
MQPVDAPALSESRKHRDPGESLFRPGVNCFTVARAAHVGLLVDGEAYFKAFVTAAERATRSILILAWDFNSNTCLRFDAESRAGPPTRLGDFLNWLTRRRRDLHVHILDWDYPLVFGVDRELPPTYGFGWRAHRRVHLAYDNTHPVSGSHHQKIVVIDDALAFIGGFDLTERRWDTPAHSPDEPHRVCGEARYPPFHDLMMAVDGQAALALAGIARARWMGATGHALPPPAPAPSRWPASLDIDFTDIDVALARTLPETALQADIHEVEALYLDMIAAARGLIYIENQYFTAYRIGEALAARLAEPDGPEIVVVVRLFSHGWLEEHTMHVLRTRLIGRLRAADHYGRFHILFPHIDGLDENICIDLHSKLMIVDDEILRIGSANLCNRSMGMDTECDAALEARGDPQVAATIHAFRNELLAEHLDVAPQQVEDAFRRQGTLRGAIDALAGRPRTLKPIDRLPEWPETVIELASVGDPAAPVSLDRLIEEFSPEVVVEEEVTPRDRRKLVKRVALKVGLFFAVVGALTAMWRYTPLAAWLDASRVTAWAEEFAGRPWAPLVILAAYTPACLVMFPRPLITLAAVVAFGPFLGFAYALSGILLAALLTYVAGLYLPRHTVHSFAGRPLRRVTSTLRRRSLLAVTALRLVPLAPFAVEGLVAAAIGIRLWHFMLGTLLGMLPGTLATTIFGDQLEAALHDPAQINYTVLAAAVVGVSLLTLAVRRWLVSQHREAVPHGDTGNRAR